MTTCDVDHAFERHRVELKVYCARMLGCRDEAEDAVQDTLVRGWTNIDRFESRSTLRTWLYRIATNVCLDMLRRRGRYAHPVDRGDEFDVDLAVDAVDDPADLVVTRDEVRRAFVAAMRCLPSRQRGVVILRDVLHWSAADVAELFGTSTVAVNSLSQRARSTLAANSAAPEGPIDLSEPQSALVERYVDAFAQYDITSLVALVCEDAPEPAI